MSESDNFKNALERKNLDEAIQILQQKFDKVGNYDEDSSRFVDILSNHSMETKYKIYNAAPLNFFYQQDSNKQTTLHNLASLKTEGVDVLSKLLQNRSEEVKRKIQNILITHYNGKPRGQGNTKAKFEALQRNQSEARLAYNPVSELVELAKKNKSTAPKFKIISEVKEKISSNINGIVRESEHTTYCVYECEVLGQKFRGKGNKKNLAKNNSAAKALSALKNDKVVQVLYSRQITNIDSSSKRPQTPLDIAIENDHFGFISKYLHSINSDQMIED